MLPATKIPIAGLSWTAGGYRSGMLGLNGTAFSLPGGTDSRSGAQDVDLSYPIDPAGLSALRHAVMAAASRGGLQGDQLQAFSVAVSELASNVIRHGAGTGRVLVWHRDGVVYCQVHDDGPGIAEPQRAIPERLPPLTAPSGRGLWLVRHLCDTVHIRSGKGTTVTISMTV